MKRSSRPRSTATLSRPVQHQLNLYALSATAAGVGLLALAQPAEAKVVYTKAHHVIYGQPSVFNLDLNHDGIVDFGLRIDSNTSGQWQALYVYAHGNSVWHTSKHFGLEWASALPAGVRIGPRANPHLPANHHSIFMDGWVCNTTKCSSSGNWLDVKNRYLGLSFLIKGKTHYGWARLSASIADHHVRATLTGYAYETIPNKPIIAGKTKGPDVITVQPASLGHLAAGAWRVKQTATTH